MAVDRATPGDRVRTDIRALIYGPRRRPEPSNKGGAFGRGRLGTGARARSVSVCLPEDLYAALVARAGQGKLGPVVRRALREFMSKCGPREGGATMNGLHRRLHTCE
jgi:hypothetical protein